MAAQAQWWQRIGNAAQIASAVIALFGFAVIIFQVNELRSNNRASGARQVYLAYSDLSFRHPQFSAPDYAVLKAGDRLVFEQYKLFVSYLLYACGAVLPARRATRRFWKPSARTRSVLSGRKWRAPASPRPTAS
jgi:hypothetical protein